MLLFYMEKLAWVNFDRKLCSQVCDTVNKEHGADRFGFSEVLPVSFLRGIVYWQLRGS